MPRAAGIARALEGAGLDVLHHRGWETRGSASFYPRGVVVHHTGPWSSVGAMVDLLIHGRSDLRGPLCHVGVDPDGGCHVIAAGRANHAGRGYWKGLQGNASVFGVEAIHSGSAADPWPARQVDAFVVAAGALARLAGVGADMVCGHKEWTSRKIDPITLDMDEFRARVARWLAPPQPIPEGVDVANAPFVAILVHPDGGYLEIGEDGGIFAYGDAPFYGSMGGQDLNAPIVGAAWAPDHNGYFLLGRDGGIFAFGSARYEGNALFVG